MSDATKQSAETTRRRGDRDNRKKKRIDPTKNVLDLVDAESRFQNGMRQASERLQEYRTDSLEKFNTAMLQAEARIQNWMRDSEMKRLKEIADVTRDSQTRIADMLRASVESTSSLVAGQLTQIQTTSNERITRLEQSRNEQAGRSSVSDPALAEALGKMAQAIAMLQQSGSANAGRATGRGDVVGWIVAAVMFVGVVLTVLVQISLLSHGHS